MLQAFMIADSNTDDDQGENGSKVHDRFFRVKQEWIDMKRKLENKIKSYNANHEVVGKIVDMIKDRESPTPKYKSDSIV